MYSEFNNKKQSAYNPKIQGKTEQERYNGMRDDTLSHMDRKNSVPLVIQVGGLAADDTFKVKMLAELLSYTTARKIKVQLLNDFDLN